MALPRFHCPDPEGRLVAGATFDLPAEAAHHAVRVLRLAVGDGLLLFDGAGREFAAVLSEIGKRDARVAVGEATGADRESHLDVTLYQALQSGDKMDYTVQKAVELGVGRIVPVDSRRSVLRLSGERAAKRVAHWQGVAVSACEQCGRTRVPEVAPIVPLAQALGGEESGGRLRLLLDPEGGVTLNQLPPGSRIDLLVGAEGGLDPEEEAAARAAGFIGLRLGPRVLRTETAALTALAALHAVRGDFC